jgi:excisionase family DNA binding protein
MQKQKTYTTGQLAGIFHVPVATIRKWIDSGRLKAFREPGKRHRKVPYQSLEAFAHEYGIPLEWDEGPDQGPSARELEKAAERGILTPEEAKAPAPAFGVGETVVWNSKTGPVEAEFRGKVRGMDGWDACIIVPGAGVPGLPYQVTVALSELEKRPEPEASAPKALRDYLDVEGIVEFLEEAIEHYHQTAPTVADHLHTVYSRVNEVPEHLTLAELVGVLRLREEGEWEHPNHAANRVYKLRDRLGMDTTGQAGF